jgi:lipid-A-disaccharide synthase
MIIAGEPSGDLHGAGVVRELKRRNPECFIFGIGGDKMAAAGMELIYNIREISVMGFWEVIQQLPLIKSVEKTMTVLLQVRKPDVILLIDYPGFNLRFAKLAHSRGIKIVYYISPQVWAWNFRRVKKMKGIIDKMLVVFPFEEDIYKREGIDVEFVGHPLLEVLTEPQEKKEFCKRYNFDEKKQILGLFPGSRRQELERIFPAMLGAARLLHFQKDVQIGVGVASALDFDFVKSFVRNDFPIQLIQNATYDLMKNSDVAIVTSGTATLETGFYQTPMIIVYRTSWFSYFVGRILVRVKNIGLVNIVAGDKIVPEILQSHLTPHRLASEALKMLEDEKYRTDISERLSIVKEKLGTKGASARVAEVLLSMI